MAGLGRRTHYRKHLTDSVLYDFPEPEEHQRIAQIVGSRGSNQFDIRVWRGNDDKNNDHATNTTALAILPSKFKKLLWLKRNDYVIVDDAIARSPHEEEEDNNRGTGGGIRYCIAHILYKDQIKNLQTKGLWPVQQSTDEEEIRDGDGSEDEDNHPNTTTATATTDHSIVFDNEYSDDDNDEFFRNNSNLNRLQNLQIQDDESSSSSEEDDE